MFKQLDPNWLLFIGSMFFMAGTVLNLFGR